MEEKIDALVDFEFESNEIINEINNLIEECIEAVNLK